jgi:hypothetical protein
MTDQTPKDPDKVKAGNARAKALKPSRRSEIASIAGRARWGPPPILAKYGAADRPLRIGEIEIPCYVLADGTRILAQRGLQGGIGLSLGGGQTGARRIAELMISLEEKGIDTRGLIARVNTPIRFIPPHGGNPADGYEATILPDICAVLIEAGRQGRLGKQRDKLAVRAAQLQHGFGTLGIIGLVDEVTGYQDYRPRDALAKILEKFVAKELRPWVRTFPAEFYKQIFRLNGWQYSENCPRPGVVGHWTNNIVYKRLAPGVLEELKRLTPKTPSGNYKSKLFQRLTEDFGHPKLREHLTGAIMLMKYAPDWQTFMDRLDREYPQWGQTLLLPYPTDYAPPAVEGTVTFNDAGKPNL